MTMPHLMNCNHQGEGWCLSCVKQLYNDYELKMKRMDLVVDFQKKTIDALEAELKLRPNVVLVNRTQEYSDGILELGHLGALPPEVIEIRVEMEKESWIFTTEAGFDSKVESNYIVKQCETQT